MYFLFLATFKGTLCKYTIENIAVVKFLLCLSTTFCSYPRLVITFPLPQSEVFLNLCVVYSHSRFGAHKWLPRPKPCNVFCNQVVPDSVVTGIPLRLNCLHLGQAVQCIKGFQSKICKAVRVAMLSERIPMGFRSFNKVSGGLYISFRSTCIFVAYRSKETIISLPWIRLCTKFPHRQTTGLCWSTNPGKTTFFQTYFTGGHR